MIFQNKKGLNVILSLIPGATFPFPKNMQLESFAKKVESHGQETYLLKETLPRASVELCPALLEEKTLKIIFTLCTLLKTNSYMTNE
jgi:hypothetical protein